jgi:hypothetical protein
MTECIDLCFGWMSGLAWFRGDCGGPAQASAIITLTLCLLALATLWRLRPWR